MKITILASIICILYVIGDVDGAAPPMTVELPMEFFRRKFANEKVGDRNAAKVLKRFLKVTNGPQKLKTITGLLRLMEIMDRIELELMEKVEMPLKCSYGNVKNPSQITFDSVIFLHDASRKLGTILEDVEQKPLPRVRRQASKRNPVVVDEKMVEEIRTNLRGIACEVLNLKTTKLFKMMNKLFFDN